MKKNYATYKDAFNLFVGSKIAAGSTRTVFHNPLDPRTVVKIERETNRRFANVMEMNVWERVADTDLAQWFAPCRHLSDDGLILIQDRTLLPSVLPAYVPAFFTDLKIENFGEIKGRFVCHDYALHLLMEKGMTKRMRKAQWNGCGYLT